MVSAMFLFNLSSYSAILRLPASDCAIASSMRLLQMSLCAMPDLALPSSCMWVHCLRPSV